MRLIDADAVLERIERDCDARCLYKDYKEPVRSKMCNCCELGDARMYVEDAPTVDAEPVIRCKDCKRSQDNEHGCILKDFNRNAFEFKFPADGFCSFRKRKDG